jgi:hypothetical protein
MPACRKDVEFVIAHDLMLALNTLLMSSSHTTSPIFLSYCSRFRLLLPFSKACKFFVQISCIPTSTAFASYRYISETSEQSAYSLLSQSSNTDTGCVNIIYSSAMS